MKCFSYLLVLLVLPSCGTFPKPLREAESAGRKQGGTRIVRIETAPPNRKIMVNNEYVGDSPISIKLDVFDKEYKYSRIKIRYTIEAYPIPGDAQNQWKVFQLVECDECGEEKPFRIFMDMSLKRANSSDVNVNIEK